MINTFPKALLWTYRLTLGDIKLDDVEKTMPWYAWVYFIICTIFVLIMFLNLLISIIGETFQKVVQASANLMYQDMVDLIVENQFLIPETAQ